MAQRLLDQQPTNVPFTMLWAKSSREMTPIEGEYDHATQKWSHNSMSDVETWSRSTTTGTFSSDPDEDKDD